jgi:hypothetical protein
MMNPAVILKFKSDWEKFTSNHPKFEGFLSAMGRTNMQEGTVLELNVTTPEGENLCTNIKLTQSDLEMIANLKQMANQK